MNIHENIKKIRTWKGIAQKVVSDYTGIPQSTLSKIESGSDFSWKNLQKIAEILEVKIEDIIGFDSKVVFNQYGDKTKGMVINQPCNEKQYQEMIVMLKEENLFLRKTLQKAIGKKPLTKNKNI